ncbi:MAG: hypothetical protein LUC93_05725 [Planctomycetaceae bacterium]|nr:hypothetical protein [Planctomycetaceae bacterium]
MAARTDHNGHHEAHASGRARGLKNRIAGWFFRTIFRPGWPQWAILAIAVVVFILALLGLTGGTDYREDPSALAPRSADIYVETRDLPALLKTVGSWRVWKEERRSAADDERNQLQVDIAGIISERVAGMSTSSPLRWLAAATRAAYCLSAASVEDGGESWALYITMHNPADALAEIEVERGMTVETLRGTREAGGVFRLTGAGAGELYFGIVGPWLVISSQAKLPEFALESARKPAFSLANSGLMPGWKRGATLRGVVNPAYTPGKTGVTAYTIITGWMASDMRVNYLSSVGKNGLETTFGAEALSGRVHGSGLWWPLVAGILLVVAVIALAAAFMVLLVMVGWGGWLKTKAMRAGIMPARGPEAVQPSEAFSADAGLDRGAPEMEAATPVTPHPAAAPVQTPPVLSDKPETSSHVHVESQTSSDANGQSNSYMGNTLPSSEPTEGYFELDKELSEGASGPTEAEVMSPESEYGIISSGNEDLVNNDTPPSDTNKSTDP